MKECSALIKELRSLENPKNIEGMARFGISSKNTLGISIPILRSMAKKIGKQHDLAMEIWESGIHEARLLAGMIADHRQLTEKQMDKWVSDLDSWDICDQVCGNLFDKTDISYKKAAQWTKDEREFVRRAGFALMAALSVHDKSAPDAKFEQFFSLIIKHSTDERNLVKKAVNWALRQIGKRNKRLNKKAVALAKEIRNIDSKAARWIAADAIRELTDKKTLSRIKP